MAFCGNAFQEKPTVDQVAWLDELGKIDEQIAWLWNVAVAEGATWDIGTDSEESRPGVEVYLWRPGDLDEIARILSKRWDYSWGADPSLSTHIGDAWTPRSLWIPGVGRADTMEAAAA